MAVDYANDWLFQNSIKRASGNLRDEMQYIMVTDSSRNGEGQLVLEIFSSDYTDPPSAGAGWGYTNPYPGFSRGEKLRPFILRFSVDIFSGERIEFLSSPDIKISFPDEVPRLKLAKELPYPIEEQKINFLNKLTAIKKVFDALGNAGIELFNTLGKGIGFVKDTAEDFFSFISKVISLGGAGLIDPAVESQLTRIQEEVEELPTTPPTESIPTKDELTSLGNEEAPNEVQEESGLVEEETGSGLCVIDPLATPTLGGMVLSEIAWMGTTNSANDEWIRLQNVSHLQNISNVSVNLRGWQLIDKDGDIEVIFKQDYLIPPRGVFLLERTDDTSKPDTPADLIYTGSLRNSNEALHLFDRNCVLRDKVEANPDWPAGDNTTKKSMERKADFTWQTSSSSGDTPNTQNSLGFVEIQQYSGGGGVSTSSSVQEEEQETEITICSQESLGASTYTPVILNEIAWMGTTNSANDEWIELKNITSNQISLENWQLLDKDNQIKVIFTNQEEMRYFYLLVLLLQRKALLVFLHSINKNLSW